MTDTQGTEIRVGSLVVYNMSGELHVGTVTDIIPRVTPAYWRQRGEQFCTFKIQLRESDHISKVKNATSILVLDY